MKRQKLMDLITNRILTRVYNIGALRVITTKVAE